MPSIQFKGKSVIETYHHTVPHHRLEFDAKLSELGKGEKPGLDGNLIIEGDNLLALKALLPTHAGKVKCVYIDPPYNTGDEEWVYNDNLTQPQFKEWINQTVGKEGEDATRHDKWCCMIYPRLRVLWELLRDDGAILVSIDENEVQNLRPILGEVFGDENFVEQIVWQKSYGGGAKSKHYVRLHEYVLCYAKNKSRIGRLSLPPDPAARKYYTSKDSKHATRGPFRTQPLWTNSMDERKNLRYPIPFEGDDIWPEKQWQWSEDRTLEALENDELVFVKTEAGVSVYYKQYLFDEDGKERGAKPYSMMEGIYTQQGTNELTRIFDGPSAFKFPKPSALIAELVRVFAKEPGDIVLDCTAGSGTTGHALLALRHDDQIERRFVLVQQAYDSRKFESQRLNICETITAERVRRVIRGYDYVKRGAKGKKTKAHEEGLGGSFSYVRVGDPLFTEYRDLGDKLPSFEDLAKYIFYTETSHEIDPKAVNEKSGFIGARGSTAYYLLYTPNHNEDRELSLEVLNRILKNEKLKRLVIYCEKFWMHPDELTHTAREHNASVRHMLVPFNLK